MNVTSDRPLNYAQELKKFEFECIVDQRTYYITKNHIKYISILESCRCNFKICFKDHFNKLNAKYLSKDYAEELKIKEIEEVNSLYKKKVGENLPEQLMNQWKNYPLNMPLSETKISLREFLNEIKALSKKRFDDACLPYNVELLEYKTLVNNLESRKIVKLMTCTDFAILYIKQHHENKTVELLEKTYMNDDAYKTIQLFLENNFGVVSNNYKKGDIIFYINNEERIIHVGVFSDNKTVISKWGKQHVFKHLPENSPYENSYIVLRNRNKV
jgi:hypothetical protein